MKLLHVDASILGANSVSRQLTAAIVKSLRDADPALDVTYSDLDAAPIGHLSGAHLAAANGATPEAPALQRDLAQGQKALEDFLAADVVVLGAPMYNFSIPSQLKAWIDRLAVAGKTFRYTEQGPEGLAGGKRLIIASSRGGFYGPQMPTAVLDHQESYLRGLFGFLGITDITFIRAEGLAVGAEQRAAAIKAATAEIRTLAA
jgi:FMN-dependent NADH-azoreductase